MIEFGQEEKTFKIRLERLSFLVPLGEIAVQKSEQLPVLAGIRKDCQMVFVIRNDVGFAVGTNQTAGGTYEALRVGLLEGRNAELA